MVAFVSSLFTSEVLIALGAVTSAAAVDALLTVLLALQGKTGAPFSWGKVPQFLLTNVLWPALGFIVGGALLKWFPDLQEPYLLAIAGVTAWLARDWRSKFNILIGVKLPAPSNQATGGDTVPPANQ